MKALERARVRTVADDVVRVKSVRAGRVWDACATSLSSICVLHCLGLPLMAGFLPIVAQPIDSHALHIGLVLLAIPVTLYVAFGEIRAGGGEWFVVAALIGLSLMVIAVAVPPLAAYETEFTMVGGTTLAGAHLWRWFSMKARADLSSLDPLKEDV